MAFIVFEGAEATGKSTQIRLLREWLESLGISCLVTREPGGSPFAEQIRALFKSIPEHGEAPLPLTELLLVMAARAQHLKQTIEPALQIGKWVLCDRFLDSTYVYQGFRAGVPKSVIDSIAKIVLSGIAPNLTLVFNLSAEIARERMYGRGDAKGDRLDSENQAVHQVLASGFERLVTDNIAWADGYVPRRILIDASGSVENIKEQIVAIISNEFGVGK
jgi:dTMP kinase